MSARDASETGGTGVGSLLGAYAEQLTAKADAPGHQNLALLGCRLCGDVTISRSGDEITIAARRAPAILQALYLITLLAFVFGMVAVILLVFPLLPWARTAISYESDATLFNQAAVFAAASFALNRALAALAGRGPAEDVQVPLSAIRVSVMGVRRRQYLLQGPLGVRGKKRRLILVAKTAADNDLLKRIFSIGAR